MGRQGPREVPDGEGKARVDPHRLLKVAEPLTRSVREQQHLAQIVLGQHLLRFQLHGLFGMRDGLLQSALGQERTYEIQMSVQEGRVDLQYFLILSDRFVEGRAGFGQLHPQVEMRESILRVDPNRLAILVDSLRGPPGGRQCRSQIGAQDGGTGRDRQQVLVQADSVAPMSRVGPGRQALGDVSVSLEIGGRKFVGRGASTDILEASAKAYVNALNRWKALAASMQGV